MQAQRIKRHVRRLLLAGCLLLSGFSLSAANFLEMESSYLGDGWFQYRITLTEDPFYQEASIGTVSIDFPGRTEYGSDPDSWSSSNSDAGRAIWNFDVQQVQTRPYERTFLARSSHTTFKTADLVAQITYSATPKEALQSGQVTPFAGVIRLRGVVPCPPGEADASEVVQTSSVSFRDELRITSLTVAGGVPTGLIFDWTYDSTVRLEASFDLKTWTPVTTISGTAGETVWTATEPLETSGNFFRLVLLANEKDP
jgi:hypothetical protein